MSFQAYLSPFRKGVNERMREPAVIESTLFPTMQYETVHNRSRFETVEVVSAKDSDLKQNHRRFCFKQPPFAHVMATVSRLGPKKFWRRTS